MTHISSTHNPQYKHLKQLVTSAKARREAGQTILDGIHLSQSYLQSGNIPAFCALSDSATENDEVQSLLDALDSLRVYYLVLSDAHYKAISAVENGIGFMLVIEPPTPKNDVKLTKNAVLLDTIQDPGNVGTILRTAAAAGVTEIYCSSGTASAWSPKVLRAGMGAQFALTIYENVDLVQLIQSSDVPVLATSLDAEKSIYDADLTRPLAWLLGNEGQGVSAELLALDVEKVIIPQAENVESLNVSMAAAVCLFEQRRQSN